MTLRTGAGMLPGVTPALKMRTLGGPKMLRHRFSHLAQTGIVLVQK